MQRLHKGGSICLFDCCFVALLLVGWERRAAIEVEGVARSLLWYDTFRTVTFTMF